MARLAAAMQTEIGLLVELRNAAVELTQVLDQSLVTLRTLERRVDELVQQQRDRFMQAIVELLAGDPGALADKWLEDAIAAKTRELLWGRSPSSRSTSSRTTVRVMPRGCSAGS